MASGASSIGDTGSAVDRVVTTVAASLGGVAVRHDAVEPVVRAAVAEQAGAGRHYHTPEHLEEMLVEVVRLVGHVPPAVATAVAWHDVVYEPRRDDNEVRSAERVRTDLAGVLPPALVDHVVDLVRSTTTHEVAAGDGAGALLHDADLWILSAPPERHRAYVRQVRAEYGHLTDAQWRAGRSAVLASLAESLTLGGYLVGDEADRARRATRARANIDHELAALRR